MPPKTGCLLADLPRLPLLPLHKPHQNNRWCGAAAPYVRRKNRTMRMTDTLDSAKLTDRVAALVEAAKTGRRRRRRRGCGARPFDRRVGAAWQGRGHRGVRERGCFATRLRRQAGGERFGNRCLRPESASRARRGDGEGLAGRSLSGPRRSGLAGQEAVATSICSIRRKSPPTS